MMPQDTLKLKKVGETNITGQKQDTIVKKNTDTVITVFQTGTNKNFSVKGQDTTSFIKSRNRSTILTDKKSTEFSYKNTADIISYYSSYVSKIPSEQIKILFPYTLIEPSKRLNRELETIISAVVKDGIKIEKNSLKSDWMLPLILFSMLVYLIIRKAFTDFIKLMNRFFTFRIIHDPITTKTFKFSSLLLDLTSYIIISLFCYSALIFFNISTGKINNFYTLIIILLSVMFLSLSRRFVTFITGVISEQKEIFADYGKVITCFYRSAGISLFFILITLLYTNFFNPGILFHAGFFIVILLYFIRIINLFLIFIRRHASILYLILYLCALEIMPVAVLVKYLKQLLQNV